MAKQQANPEQFVDLLFPISGVDVSAEFEKQRQATCAVGVNVRAFDPLTNRARGGSRVGLSRYLLDQIGGGANVFQELTLLVDPQAQAVGISFPDVPFFDPAVVELDWTGLTLADGTPNWIFLGGSGSYTNKGYKRKNPPPADIAFVQTARANYGLGLSAQTVAFPANVAIGDLLVIAVAFYTGGGTGYGRVAGITDSLGNSYTQVGAYVDQPDNPAIVTPEVLGTISIWYALSVASGPNTVTITPTSLDLGNVYMNLTALEFSGANHAAPLDSSGPNFRMADVGDPSAATGAIAVGSAKEMVLAAFAVDPTSGSFSSFTAGFVDSGNFVRHLLGRSSAITPSGTLNSAVFGYAAMGASFRK